jgi:hypothetical protein
MDKDKGYPTLELDGLTVVFWSTEAGSRVVEIFTKQVKPSLVATIEQLLVVEASGIGVVFERPRIDFYGLNSRLASGMEVVSEAIRSAKLILDSLDAWTGNRAEPGDDWGAAVSSALEKTKKPNEEVSRG